MTMADLVYILCGLTSLVCAVLLLRSYIRVKSRILLWSGLCFTALFLNNTLLFADAIIFPDVYLLPWRHVMILAGAALLLYGLIWETT